MPKLSLAEKIRFEYLGLDPTTVVENPFDHRSQFDKENPHLHTLKMMRNPNYFHYTCKTLMCRASGIPLEILPFQQVILKELWYRPFPMLLATRGGSKSFLLGLYALLRALFIQGRRIVITGSGFRQAKTIFNYIENIWVNSPILQSLVAESSRSGPHHDADRWWMGVGDSTITALPLGNGDKIRGERAHDIIADEFRTIPWEIFETVVSGFSVVELDPVEKVKRQAEIRVLQRENIWTKEMAENERLRKVGNQTIISGTASYQFEHFFDYWKRWKGVVESKGDKKILASLFPNEVDKHFDWRDYSIIRLPVELLPPGFMNDAQIARSRMTHHTSSFFMEFGAVFPNDSNGFFKRSLIESCVVSPPIVIGGKTIQFRANTKGNPSASHIFGVDTASESDRFSIVILEVHPDHRRVVFCWTTTRQEHRKRLQAGLTKTEDYYGFCARKIRDLMKSFPCEHISMDSQGGGIAVLEALHDKDKRGEGEAPIWLINADHPLSDGKERETDHEFGLHILEMVNFSSAQWVAEANHGLRKDLEDKVLLFPEYDTALLAIAMEDDQMAGRMYDTLEDAVAEVEEIKEELSTIVHTQTTKALRDHWDTPEVKLEGSRKGRLRKDRYTSLLMANASARKLSRCAEEPVYAPWGGFVNNSTYITGATPDNKMYLAAPAWFTKESGDKVTHLGVIEKPGVDNR